ncbi:hypothetical protein [Arthrobacter sp. IK3]|uniref:hypothetical protein n=1 Tax=Arthrobacter sp. IK3 TaxID=3448169 RepID=UPI003EE3310A
MQTKSRTPRAKTVSAAGTASGPAQQRPAAALKVTAAVLIAALVFTGLMGVM